MTKYNLSEFVEYCLKNKETFSDKYENFEIVVKIKTTDGTNISRIALLNTFCLNRNNLEESYFYFEHNIKHVDGSEYNLNYFSFNALESEENKLNYFKKLDSKLADKQIETVNIYIVSMNEY